MKACADAHALLNYLISRASLEGNVGTVSIHIPLMEITDSEGPAFTDDAINTVLKITVTTAWEAADDVEELLESDFGQDTELIASDIDEESEEERDNAGNRKEKGHRGDPDKNSGSH